MQQISRGSGKDRRTLKKIKKYPRPRELYDKIVYGKGWDYSSDDKDYFLKRDRALVALLYLLALRISEALRLCKSQFATEKNRIVVSGIELSKTKIKGKPRKDQYRQEAFLPLSGNRAMLTQLVTDYLRVAKTDKLFINDTSQAYKYVVALIGEPCHWLRAYGENYLYDNWEHDLLAVADYVKVDPRTLTEYIRRAYKKYTDKAVV
jgi:integrase